MDLQRLEKDRFLRQDPNQNDTTKGASYAAINPAPKRGDDALRKIGRPKGSEEDDGAPNILTGTVIVSCFIQTSALPYRIEMQGNDLTFFDDTYTENGTVIGDTSRLIFTHASGKRGEVITQGFILEKRASIHNTYDNVLSLYALEPIAGAGNYLFIGRNGSVATSGGDQRYINSINLSVNADSDFIPPEGDNPINGTFNVDYAEDGTFISPIIFSGNSESLLPSSGLTGFSALIVGGSGGISGLSYLDGTDITTLLYLISPNEITVGADMLPDVTATYDIGSPTFKFGTFYGSVSACPLPTVDNALEILERIEEPTYVGERGHYGENRKYFDDLTFPPEILYTDKKGRTDIEHNHMLGFLLKAVIELKQEVDFLKEKISSM